LTEGYAWSTTIVLDPKNLSLWEATISNIKIFDAKNDLFTQPIDSKLIEKASVLEQFELFYRSLLNCNLASFHFNRKDRQEKKKLLKMKGKIMHSDNYQIENENGTI